MTIDEQIYTLGNCFRGLWRCNELTEHDDFIIKWYVTFVYKGELIESPSCDDMKEALDFAIDKLTIKTP